MGMRHLRAANGVHQPVPAAEREASEICLVDYSHCPNADLCWIADFDNGCVTADSCIVDTQ
jgi:hypothetical protein